MRKIVALFILLSMAALNLYAAGSDGEDPSKGIEFIKNEKYGEAIEEFTKIIALNPDNPEAYNNRGIAYLARMSDKKPRSKDLNRLVSDFNNANEDFTKAIGLKSDFAAAYYNRGLTNISYYEKAISDFTRTIELKPDHARAYYYRAVEYFNLKEYSRSWSDIHEAQRLGCTIDPLFLKKLKERAPGN